MTLPCIYCGSTAARTGREHVIPQAFGRFKNNWTLDCVCDQCNHYFSRELELSFARDGAEGYFRLQTGLKPAEGSRQLLNRRLLATIQEPGPYFGAHSIFKPDSEGKAIEPIPKPQVGFKRETDAEITWVLEEDLSRETVAPYLGPGVHVRIVASRDEIVERLTERIRALGVNFIKQGTFQEPITNPDKSVWLEIGFRVDETALRAAAKIAFNYAALTLGPDVVRASDFDTARQFVRLGKSTGKPPVRVTRRPILAGDKATDRQTQGHLISLEWVEDWSAIVCRVSLFNVLTYEVVVCRTLSDRWREIAVGHHLDPANGEITLLSPAPDE